MDGEAKIHEVSPILLTFAYQIKRKQQFIRYTESKTGRQYESYSLGETCKSGRLGNSKAWWIRTKNKALLNQIRTYRCRKEGSGIFLVKFFYHRLLKREDRGFHIRQFGYRSIEEGMPIHKNDIKGCNPKARKHKVYYICEALLHI